ncbi:peptidoglycan glycosyltransferase, partial [Escherichia coli]|nr:peptidoglycan glycosyltransferase [Escherichia coli]
MYTSDTLIQRFRADVFGKANIDDLAYNEKLGFDEATATPTQIVNYLQGSRVYNISEEYGKKLRYEIMVVRYNMGQNSYQKYISTVIASDVSQESVAYI